MEKEIWIISKFNMIINVGSKNKIKIKAVKE
ncbi:unnamed protein product, partial [marine sediment metagenome]